MKFISIFSILFFAATGLQAQKKLPQPEPGHSEIWYALDVIQKNAPHLTEFVTSAVVDTVFEPCPDVAKTPERLIEIRIDTLRDTVHVFHTTPAQVTKIRKVYVEKRDTIEKRDTVYLERRTFVPNSTHYVDNGLRVAFILSALIIGVLLWKLLTKHGN